MSWWGVVGGGERARLEERAERRFALVSGRKGVLRFDTRGGRWEKGALLLSAGCSPRPEPRGPALHRRLPAVVAACQVPLSEPKPRDSVSRLCCLLGSTHVAG